jgi:hypothetical protein
VVEDGGKNMNMKPYSEKENGNIVRRTFKKDVSEQELTWHRDREDRVVLPINENDWFIQMDNELPKKLDINEEYFIPKNTYHRVIKGSTDLMVEVIKTVFEEDEYELYEGLEEGKKKKKDACYHKVKSRYDVWPSAYASGALVKCRKVGAKNWGNKTDESEELSVYEAKKTDFSKEKEKGLHGWFERQGGSGKSQGWVDCNTCKKDPETGRKKCKPCGREEGEDRKYPACRPTPSACGTKGKGDKWGKKSNESFDMSYFNYETPHNQTSNLVIDHALISEQLLYENFINSMVKYAGDKWDKAITTIKDWKDVAAAIGKMISSGDIEGLLGPIWRYGIKIPLKTLKTLLDKLKLTNLYDEYVLPIINKIGQLKGWKGFVLTLSIGSIIKYITSKLSNLSPDGMKKWIVAYFSDDAIDNIISKLTNFTTFLGWIQPIVKGVEIIFDILKSSLDRLNRANPLEISNTTSESFNVLVNSNQKSSIFAENTKSMILQKLHEMDISNFDSPIKEPVVVPKIKPTTPSPRRKRIWEVKPAVAPKPKM